MKEILVKGVFWKIVVTHVYSFIFDCPQGVNGRKAGLVLLCRTSMTSKSTVCTISSWQWRQYNFTVIVHNLPMCISSARLDLRMSFEGESNEINVDTTAMPTWNCTHCIQWHKVKHCTYLSLSCPGFQRNKISTPDDPCHTCLHPKLGFVASLKLYSLSVYVWSSSRAIFWHTLEIFHPRVCSSFRVVQFAKIWSPSWMIQVKNIHWKLCIQNQDL